MIQYAYESLEIYHQFDIFKTSIKLFKIYDQVRLSF